MAAKRAFEWFIKGTTETTEQGTRVINIEEYKQELYKFSKGTTETTEQGTRKINIEEYKQELHNKGFSGVKEKLNKDLRKWTDIELNTAVVGNSGTGKSSFINAIRGMTAEDKGAAKVGVTETTVEPEPYTHLQNKSFIIWDLPGVGTPDFPKASYLEKVTYDKYDIFIIISNGRFTENDLWLANEVQNRKKKFFFIRSKVDLDLEDDKNDHPSTHNETNVLQIVRKTTEEGLIHQGVKEPKVFLISNRHRNKYDFGKLNTELLLSCDGLKQDSMALSLAAVSKEVRAEKKRVLQGRIPRIALLVASSEGEYEQKGRFQDEIKFYQKQFDIDDATLAENKDILTLSDRDVQEFKVVFDTKGSDGGMSVATPTAKREAESRWERFKDLFKSKENKLLYGFCEVALENNLAILYQKADSLYDLQRTTQMIHAVSK